MKKVEKSLFWVENALINDFSTSNNETSTLICDYCYIFAPEKIFNG